MPQAQSGEQDMDRVRHGYAPDDGMRDFAAKFEPGPKPDSLHDIGTRLVSEAKGAMQAEVDLLSARAALLGSGAKRTSLWGLVAFLSLWFGVIALIIGLLFALAPLVGPWWSILLVAGPLFIVAIIAALAAKAATRDVRDAVKARIAED